MKPSEAAKCVAMLQAAFPAARWSEPTVALYEHMLCELEYERARKAIVHIIRTSKFLPTIAEVFDTVEAERGQQHLTVRQLMAAEAAERAADRRERGLKPDHSEAIHDPAEIDRLIAGIGRGAE